MTKESYPGYESIPPSHHEKRPLLSQKHFSSMGDGEGEQGKENIHEHLIPAVPISSCRVYSCACITRWFS